MVLVRIIFVSILFFGVSWSSADYNICTEECLDHYDADRSKVPSAMDLFLDWATKNGAKFPKLVVNESMAGSIRGRTIHASEAIATGEEVLFIPENMLISYWRAKRTRIGNLVSKEAVRKGLPTGSGNLEQDLVVTAFFLHESKDPNSFWKPYIETLPDLGHMPPNFIELCRSELRNTYTILWINQQYKVARDAYELYSHVGPYSWNEYLQAFLYVQSRSFVIPAIGLEMVPIADLMNHHHPPHVDWSYDTNRNGYFIEARTSIKRNEEVTESYGLGKSAGRIFAGFGFVLSDSVHSNARIHVSLAHYFPDFQEKKEAMPRSPHPYFRNLESDYIIAVPENYDTFDIKNVFQHLRILTQPIELTTDNNFLFEITVDSEQIMLKEFILVLEAASDRMQSSHSEDRALLKVLKGQEEEAERRIKQLVRVRIEERNVLLSWKILATECISILRNRAMLETSYFSSYIDRVISPLVLGVRVNLD